MDMDTATAFAAYEAARNRMPPTGRQGAGIRAANLSEIADHFDVFLLDAFGVLNIGDEAIPGVAERLAALRKQGKRLFVLSNAAGVPHEDLMRKYAGLGYDFQPEDVITSRSALMAALKNAPPRHWGLMSADNVPLGELARYQTSSLGDDPVLYDEVQGFLLVGASGWTEVRQELLESSLRANPRPVWIGNPDIVAPREGGFSLQPGHFAHRLADATGVQPEFFGKPFGNIYDLIFARLGPEVPRDRVVMVGDSPHTDILGAQVAGIGSALVSGWGFFGGQDPEPYLEKAGIHPDFILERP